MSRGLCGSSEGGSLHMDQINECPVVMIRRETDQPRKVFNTSDIFGRRRGFRSQQLSINTHNSSVRFL